MTAAEMLAGDQTDAASAMANVDLQLGCLVLHPEFGPGKVVDVHGSGKSQTVAVRFLPSAMTRKFRAAFSPLRAIGPMRRDPPQHRCTRRATPASRVA